MAARTRRCIPGIETRQLAVDRRDRTSWKGIPVTTPARTLVDLAAVVSAGELARAVHQAGIRHGTTPDDVEAVLARRPRAKGVADLREVLHGDHGKLLSRLERAFIKFLKDNNLPLPVTKPPSRRPPRRLPLAQAQADGGLDSYRHHRSRHAFEQDRRRERQAYARGDQFRRYTWGDIVEHPGPALRELRAVLTPV